MLQKSVFLMVWVLFIKSNTLVAQPKLSKEVAAYYTISNKFQWAKHKGYYALAFSYFKELEQIRKPNKLDVQDYIIVCVKMKNKAEANKWIEYSIKTFNYKCSYYYAVYMHKLYNYGLTEEEVLKMPCSKNEQKLQNEFITADKMETLITIFHIQENTILFKNQFKKFNFDNCLQKKKPVFAKNIAKQYDTAYVLPALLKIIKQYNFPDANDIGATGIAAFNGLLHQVLYNKAHLSILDSALYNGKLIPREYAALFDEIYNYDAKTKLPKNSYGTLLEPNKDGSKMQVKAIDNVAELDKRRAAIGLMPLWQEAKIQNYYTLPKQYIDYLKNNNIPFEE